MSSDNKSSGGKARHPAIDRDLIKDLAGLLTETDLTEIEVEAEGLRLRVVRQPATQTFSAPAPAPASAPVAAAPAAAPAPAEAASHPGAVTSPMVGTGYLSPEPGAATFVKEGDTVREGQTLMIVEAMKTMNPIPATRAGKVTRVLVSDGQPVEYGEALMIIE